jgi:glucosamine-6-phosphate deaminase
MTTTTLTEPIAAFNQGKSYVMVFSSQDDLGRAAATQAADVIGNAIEQRGKARIIVGTGNSQDRLIHWLTKQPGVNWQAVEVFHMDEYVGMPSTHSASFARWLRAHLAEKVNGGTFHYVTGDAPDLDAEMNRYAKALTSAPIDLCFIGFGENGHIAFNDPHVADFNDPKPIKRVEMDEKCRMQQVGEGHFPSLHEAPREAVTLTCPTLMSARTVIAVVPERRKAQAVLDAIEGPLTTKCPASLVLTHPAATIYLDRDSASLLARMRQ